MRVNAFSALSVSQQPLRLAHYVFRRLCSTILLSARSLLTLKSRPLVETPFNTLFAALCPRYTARSPSVGRPYSDFARSVGLFGRILEPGASPLAFPAHLETTVKWTGKAKRLWSDPEWPSRSSSSSLDARKRERTRLPDGRPRHYDVQGKLDELAENGRNAQWSMWTLARREFWTSNSAL